MFSRASSELRETEEEIEEVSVKFPETKQSRFIQQIKKSNIENWR